MICYQITDILNITKGRLITCADGHAEIKDILIDSRQFNGADFTLFIAIKSKRNDGHLFIDELYDKGIRNFIVSTEPDNAAKYTDCNIIHVRDCIAALQALAVFHRKKFSIPVIGIAGSNGKTIVKEWLYQLLHTDKNIVRSPKSYNSQIGVPLSVWMMKPENDIAIFEAGVSQPDEMNRLQPIIRPNIGIFTNIGTAHEENFVNISQKISEKLSLFTKADVLIYCSDYSDISERIASLELFRNIRLFTWGRKNDAVLSVKEINVMPKHTQISAVYLKKLYTIDIPFTDQASIENAIHCLAAMIYLGYGEEDIAMRMKNLTPIEMRLESRQGINNCTIINDAYSLDFNSLKIALDFLDQQNRSKNKTVILSDMFQSRKSDFDLYQEISRLLVHKKINRLIGIGKFMMKYADLFPMERYSYESTAQFLREFSFSAFQNEIILLKGARIFEFEKISRLLEQKAHETVLEINLNALIHNFNFFRLKLNPGTRIMAMVKAFSYGAGSDEIANILQYHHADYLAVAFADEGIELRKAGITMPIMVMNPEEKGIDSVIKYGLEPEIYNFRVLGLFEEAINDYYSGTDAKLKIHIKFDTGMHRLGFEKEDIPVLAEQINANPHLEVVSAFSHLAASEEKRHDAFTHHQAQLLTEMHREFQQHFDYPVMKHILNSAGILRFPEYHFDMVRTGIGLYGVTGSKQDDKFLENVCTLKTNISQLRHIRAGNSVGYNLKWKATVDSVIAVIPIGYADGLNRRLGNGKGKVLLRGKFAPIIGNICMDMCSIDVTGMDVKENDEVIIFGKEFVVNELAALLDTIPYEILAGISQRVKRVYYQE